MTSMELREIEKSKIKCARKFFHKVTSDKVKYDVVNGFDTLMKLVYRVKPLIEPGGSKGAESIVLGDHPISAPWLISDRG